MRSKVHFNYYFAPPPGMALAIPVKNLPVFPKQSKDSEIKLTIIKNRDWLQISVITLAIFTVFSIGLLAYQNIQLKGVHQTETKISAQAIQKITPSRPILNSHLSTIQPTQIAAPVLSTIVKSDNLVQDELSKFAITKTPSSGEKLVLVQSNEIATKKTAIDVIAEPTAPLSSLPPVVRLAVKKNVSAQKTVQVTKAVADQQETKIEKPLMQSANVVPKFIIASSKDDQTKLPQSGIFKRPSIIAANPIDTQKTSTSSVVAKDANTAPKTNTPSTPTTQSLF